jgi:GntR family transcriptional repressor for pyruvate dehydrogenase complex
MAADPNVIPVIHVLHDPSSEIAAHLERLITTGRLGPRTKLPPERELAEHFAVSRPTLREALLELEHKRLVERRQGRGTIVLDPPRDAWDLRAMTASSAPEYIAELRYSIEPSIARLAALRATPSDLLQVRNAIVGADEHLREEVSMEVDIEFHMALARASHNPLMAALVASTTEWTREERLSTHSSPEWRRLSVHGHNEILAALEARDPDGAERAMADHLLDVRRRVEEATGQSRDY